MKRNLTRRERLKSKSDLRRIFSAAGAECRGLKILFCRNDLQWNRIVCCPVRGLKTAVKRNREKRICREVYRTIKNTLHPGYDLAFILYPGNYSFAKRFDQVNFLLNKAGLIR